MSFTHYRPQIKASHLKKNNIILRHFIYFYFRHNVNIVCPYCPDNPLSIVRVGTQKHWEGLVTTSITHRIHRSVHLLFCHMNDRSDLLITGHPQRRSLIMDMNGDINTPVLCWDQRRMLSHIVLRYWVSNYWTSLNIPIIDQVYYHFI